MTVRRVVSSALTLIPLNEHFVTEYPQRLHLMVYQSFNDDNEYTQVDQMYEGLLTVVTMTE